MLPRNNFAKVILIIICLVINQACASNKANAPNKPPAPENTKSIPAVKTDTAAVGESIESIIKTQLPGFRLAQAGDYLNILSADDRGKPIYQGDFNNDGKQDYAVLVVNSELKEYRIYYLLKDGEKYRFELLLTQKADKVNKDGKILNPMFLKPVGENGIAGNDNNTLVNFAELPESTTSEEREKIFNEKVSPYKAVPAVEVWTGFDEKENNQLSLEIISFCSTAWYYDKGKLKNFNACD